MKWYCEGNEHDCCDTDFVTCADEVLSLAPTWDDYQKWLDRGIVEYSTLGGVSGLCALYDYVQTIPLSEYKLEFINFILEQGLVIVCDTKTGQYTYLYSVEAYANSLQAQPQP